MISKKYLFLALAVNLLFMASQPVFCQQYLENYWYFKTEINPFDDSVQVYAKPIRKDFESQNIDLWIRCLNEFAIFIETEVDTC